MKELDITITHPVGLHARPAALFVQTASKYASDVNITFDGNTKNAKSILSVLSMGICANSNIKITADGDDEDEVLKSLKALIEDNFGE